MFAIVFKTIVSFKQILFYSLRCNNTASISNFKVTERYNKENFFKEQYSIYKIVMRSVACWWRDFLQTFGLKSQLNCRGGRANVENEDFMGMDRYMLLVIPTEKNNLKQRSP